MEEEEDLATWLGKLPEKARELTPQLIADANPDADMFNHNLTESSMVGPEGSQEQSRAIAEEHTHQTSRAGLVSEDEEDDVVEVGSFSQEVAHVCVEVPPVPSDEDKYEYLRGHHKVRRVMAEYRGNRFLVELQSGEIDLVCS